MNIEHEDETTVTFDSLDIGDIFRHHNYFYMKRSLNKTAPNNSINLKSGTLVGFSGSDLVVHYPDAVLKLKG